LRHKSCVFEAPHQHYPSTCDADGIPAGRRRFSRKPVARQRGDDDIKSVLGAPIISRRIGEWANELQLLDDRAGPSVRDDDRQCIWMFRTNVNEMNVYSIDRGDKVRQASAWIQYRTVNGGNLVETR
jgi:hypothetical protein